MSLTIKKRESTTFQSVKSPLVKNQLLTVEITALSQSNLGLAELPNGYTLLIPNVNLGDEVRVQIQKIFAGNTNYATAKAVEILKKAETNFNFKVGDCVDVTITKAGPNKSGLARLENFGTLIVPQAKVGETVQVQITRIKKDYAFGQMTQKSNQQVPDPESFQLGTKFHLILPEKTQYFSKYAIIKIQNKVVFVKMQLGAELGKQVKIQLIRVTNHFAIAKVIQIAPLFESQKQLLVKKSLEKMVETGLHFGEKAIRCHANMRKFVWVKKKGKYQNRPFLRKGRHILNVLKTRRCLNKALKQLGKYAAKGKTFLFVGTKKSAGALIARTAMLSQTSFFVNTRWLGGMLTNWKTILKSISQIRPILKEKQRIIQTILEKRQRIKARLIQKVNLLRKKTTKLMLKGKHLIQKIQQNKMEFFTKSQKLLLNKKAILLKNQLLVTKYSALTAKQQQFYQQSQLLTQQGNQLISQKQLLVTELQKSQQKLKNFQQLFLIGQELLKIKQLAETDGKTIWAVPYAKFIKLLKQADSTQWLIPNPSKEIFNQIIGTFKLTETADLDMQMLMQNTNFAKSSESTAPVLVISKILEKFVMMLPILEKSFQKLVSRIDNLQMIIQSLTKSFEMVQSKFVTIQSFDKQTQQQIQLIEKKLGSQADLFQNLKIQLKRLASEQRLLKFLPRLRYLPTPKTKMIETVEILMKKFVDPKMTYPVDQIYDQKLKFTSKKIAAMRKQKWQRLEKYFGGVTKMAKMQKQQISQNVAIIVGQQEEMNAVLECQKLGIKMFTIVDTNCNPRLSDHIIPANDDSRNSIKFVLGEMLTHIRLAQKLRQKILLKRLKRI
jgi:small subunit ribosomal protein S2